MVMEKANNVRLYAVYVYPLEQPMTLPESVNDKSVCRTASATPGLLIIYFLCVPKITFSSINRRRSSYEFSAV